MNFPSSYGTRSPQYQSAMQAVQHISTQAQQDLKVRMLMFKSMKAIRELQEEFNSSLEDVAVLRMSLDNKVAMADALIHSLHGLPIPEHLQQPS